MNQRADKPLQHGHVAQLLLRSPRKRAKLPKALQSSIVTCDDVETVTPSVRVSGPYRNGNKWRLVVFDPNRTAKLFDDYETAMAVKARLLAEVDGRLSKTIDDAVTEYLAHKRKYGCTERTVRSVQERLAFLPADATLSSITPKKAEALYSEQSEKVAAATHHGSLKNANAFFKWCVKQGYLENNPFSEVQRIGKAKRGKLQLREDEAKTLSNYLIDVATKGDYRAMALLVQVLLGLRSGEVLGLRKRDIDRQGTRVVIDGTKNANAKRTVRLEDAPIVMDLLMKRIAPLAAEALIFVPDERDQPVSTTSLHKALVVFCKHAGVPRVCPHSLRGLNATLAVEAGATCALVARALGHGSDAVTRRHYIAPSALDIARSSRVGSALLGSRVDSAIATLRGLTAEELDAACSAVGYRR